MLSSFQLLLGDRDLNNDIDNANLVIRNITETHRHPDWRYNYSADYDAAIWVMDRQVEYTPFIRPACLPKRSDDNVNKYNNNFVTLIGKH